MISGRSRSIPRLALQLAVVTFLFVVLPPQIRIFEMIPVALERAFLVLGLLWFINLVNFMDGLDWMTVAEMLPMTWQLAAFAWLGETPPAVLPIALALAAPCSASRRSTGRSRRLFLGDVGSLPIGLLLGWSLLQLASRSISPRRCCCRSIISLTRRSRCSAA